METTPTLQVVTDDDSSLLAAMIEMADGSQVASSEIIKSQQCPVRKIEALRATAERGEKIEGFLRKKIGELTEDLAFTTRVLARSTARDLPPRLQSC